KACTIVPPSTSCIVVPTGADVGIQTLRAVLTDLAGATAETSTRVEVPRFEPKDLIIDPKHKKTKKAVTTTFTSELDLPKNVTAKQGCADAKGTIDMIIKDGNKVLKDSQVKLGKTCKASLSLTGAKSKSYTVTARFGGNNVLLPISKTRKVKK